MNLGWIRIPSDSKQYFCFIFAVLMFHFAFAHPAQDQQAYLLDVYLNKERTASLLACFIDQQDRVWVEAQMLKHWSLRQPETSAWLHNHKRYYCLDQVQDIQYHFEKKALSLHIEIPPRYLPVTTIGGSAMEVGAIRPTHPGGFINYDSAIQHNASTHKNMTSLFTEFGYFNRYGVGINDFILSDKKQVRLDSTWILDKPENSVTWRFGDAVTSIASWSGAVRFGGIQWGTNFSTQPYLITYPVPSFKGEAAVATQMSIFVNDALRVSKEIRTGPYAVYNLPVVTGAGTVKIVTQNRIGGQEEIILPYYTSEKLLKAGLRNYAYELGFIRNDFGLHSFKYSDLIAVGTYREGINDRWTVGWHGECLARQQTLGFSSEVIWKQYLVFSSALAASQSHFGKGALMLLGLQRQTDSINYGMQGMITNRRFSALGFSPQQALPFFRGQSFLSYATPNMGSFGISYTVVKNKRALENTNEEPTSPFLSLPDIQLITLSYNKNIRKYLFLVCSGLIDLYHHQNRQWFASLIWAWKPEHTFSATQSFFYDKPQQSVLLNKNLPWGEGYGYHISASQGNFDKAEGAFSYQNSYGTYSGTVTKLEDAVHYIAQAKGAMFYFNKHLLFSRENYDSFTLVEIPGFEQVCIYDRNTCIGRTNKKGLLIVPHSLAYQKNKIAIEPTEFPLNVEIDQTEVEVIPYYRSGVLAQFSVKRVYHLSSHLLQENGKPVPSGALIRLQNTVLEKTYPIGDAGAFFVTSENPVFTGRATWEQGECVFQHWVPKNGDLLHQAREVFCYAVNP